MPTLDSLRQASRKAKRREKNRIRYDSPYFEPSLNSVVPDFKDLNNIPIRSQIQYYALVSSLLADHSQWLVSAKSTLTPECRGPRNMKGL